MIFLFLASAALDIVLGSGNDFHVPRKPYHSSISQLSSANSRGSRHELVSKLNAEKLLTDHSRIPEKVISDLRCAGANVTKLIGNMYLIQNIRFGDAVSGVFAAIAESSSNDPVVVIDFAPNPSLMVTCINPSMDLGPEILREARSICSHYALLLAHHFVGAVPPLIPGPLLRPPIMQNIRHPKIALTQLCSRIQDPAHPAYPTLTALRSGSYICSVSFHWLTSMSSYAVFKP